MRGLGPRLRARARQLGLSDAQVARRTGLGERRYANYVAGTREPDFETLVRISRTLNLTPNELLAYEPSPDRDTASLLKERMDAAWNVLNEDERGLAVDLVEALLSNRLKARSRTKPAPSSSLSPAGRGPG